MDLYPKKIAVLDLTHGGIPIAKKLATLGYEVTGIDVYGTVDPGMLIELEEKNGIYCSKDSLPSFGFDLLVAPIHLDSAYPMISEARADGKRIISHHEIVGKILKNDSRLSAIKTIEITGVKAKTSTASILADILSRKFDVALHTSRGLETWKRGISSLIYRGLSITPGSILVVVEKVFEVGFKPDFFIFEISIGGTGNADIGILTTLFPDYRIGNNTTLASEAKLQLVRSAKIGSTLILNAGAKKALEVTKESQAKVLTFKDPFDVGILEKTDKVADFALETRKYTELQSISSGLSALSVPSKLSELSVVSTSSDVLLDFMRREDKIFSAALLAGYNISAYRTAFIAASAAALELGVECEVIVAVLEGFRGLLGRMQENELNGIALIDNSNSGMDILSTEKAFEYALLKKKDDKKNGGVILILGEEASQVCEGLQPASVQDLVKKLGMKYKQIILVGERMKAIVAKNAFYAASLPEGLAKASELARKDDIILSSVKCFR
jgi:UDP-N-acetylmuramyl pentapeptide synthase